MALFEGLTIFLKFFQNVVSINLSLQIFQVIRIFWTIPHPAHIFCLRPSRIFWTM